MQEKKLQVRCVTTLKSDDIVAVLLYLMIPVYCFVFEAFYGDWAWLPLINVPSIYEDMAVTSAQKEVDLLLQK